MIPSFLSKLGRNSVRFDFQSSVLVGEYTARRAVQADAVLSLPLRILCRDDVFPLVLYHIASYRTSTCKRMMRKRRSFRKVQRNGDGTLFQRRVRRIQFSHALTYSTLSGSGPSMSRQTQFCSMTKTADRVFRIPYSFRVVRFSKNFKTKRMMKPQSFRKRHLPPKWAPRCLFCISRRVWDSNPRDLTSNGFQDTVRYRTMADFSGR